MGPETVEWIMANSAMLLGLIFLGSALSSRS
jgi:hypothetical protein